MQRDAAGRFVERLFALRQAEDRAALAALRRGAGRKPGTEPAMFPHMPWVPERIDSPEYVAAFLTASFFALHPAEGGSGSFGAVMRRIRDKTGSGSIEARLVALLQAHPEDLPGHLRGCVTLAGSNEVPVDWTQFLMDITGLLSGGDWADNVRKRWAQDFWAPRQGEVPEEQTGDLSGGES